MLKFLLLMLLITSNLYAQDIKTVPVTDDSGFNILNENGSKIVSEYIEQCRDVKSGKYIKCPKEGENKGLFRRKLQKVCRDGVTGRFIKCPK